MFYLRLHRHFSKISGTMNKGTWDKIGDWFDAVVGSEGGVFMYYHQKMGLPNVLRLLALKSEPLALVAIW